MLASSGRNTGLIRMRLLLLHCILLHLFSWMPLQVRSHRSNLWIRKPGACQRSSHGFLWRVAFHQLLHCTHIRTVHSLLCTPVHGHSTKAHLDEDGALLHDTCDDSLLPLRRKQLELLLHEMLPVMHRLLIADST